MKTTHKAGRVAVRRKSRLSSKARARSAKTGLPPGTLVYVGDAPVQAPSVTVIEYDEDRVSHRELVDVAQALPSETRAGTCWISVNGLTQTHVIEALGDRFGIHPLVLEDIVNTTQRPKIDYYDEYLYIVLRLLSYHEETGEISSEQMSIVLGKDFLLTFREREGEQFAGVIERLTAGKGRIRKGGADYLAYCLMDAIVDDYFGILEKLAEQIEAVEEALVADPGRLTLHGIHTLKTDMIHMRRSVWPIREVLNSLARGDGDLVKSDTIPYLRDVYDHTVHVIDNMESYRDIITGMLDIYLSSMSNRLNEIMKVLTIIATIFIPLTFMTGWYGMNFKGMPELQWPWSYPVFAGFAATAAVVMLILFRIKKWF
ncbi:MAG: magnesium/cobalt transporter CorA [Thermodesulfobacteriota bacterium]